MSLNSDANSFMDLEENIVKESINLDILEKIENDLDIGDVVSILFLMVSDYNNVFQKIFELYHKAKLYGTSVIIEIVKDNRRNWEDKLLESICICNNRKVIKKLGLQFEDLEKCYLPKCRLYAKKLNPIAKCLYLLCESLTTEETKMLLHSVKEDKIFLSINEDKKYETILKDTDQLELHLLYWLNIGYISIFSAKKGNFKDFLKHLNAFEDIKSIIEDLEYCDRNQNISRVDTSEGASSFSGHSNNEIEAGDREESVRKIKKGLCVIINQINFSGLQYETRSGTILDAEKLLKTFKGFGFTVHIIEDLTKHQILSNIRNLPKHFGCDYDCIFLCILSHGCEGGIIAIDEEEVSIHSISNAFCCPEFSKIIKIVIIQACQGRIRGKVLNRDNLMRDGPNEPMSADIMVHSNFCIFMSTLQGFAAMRDKEKGSWFIQELCNILQHNGRKINFFKCATKVIKVMKNKRGTMDGDCVAQIPELLHCRLDTDFELLQCDP